MSSHEWYIISYLKKYFDTFRLLESYKASHANIDACYAVSGESENGTHRIVVCRDSQLEGMQSGADTLIKSQKFSLNITYSYEAKVC